MMETLDHPTLSYKTQWLTDKQPPRWGWVLTWALIGLCYLAGVSDKWSPTPDSALYLSLGRSISQGQGYVFNGKPNVLASPGLPWVLAGMNYVFGESILLCNLLIVLCAIAGLIMLRLALNQFGDQRICLAVVLLTAFSYPFFANTQRILTDIPFAMLFWTSIYAVIRWQKGSHAWGLLVFVTLLYALLVRAPGVIMYGPLGLGLILQGRKHLAARRTRIIGLGIWAGLFGGLCFLWFLKQQMNAKGVSYASAGQSIAASGIWTLVLAFFEGLCNIPFAFAELSTSQEALVPIGAALVILSLIGVVHTWKNGPRFIPVMVLTSLGLHAILGAHSIRPRYLLSLYPFFLYLSLQGLFVLVTGLAKRKKQVLSQTTLLKILNVTVVILLACSAPKFIRNIGWYTWWRHSDTFYERMREGKFADHVKIAEILRSESRPEDRIGVTDQDIRIMHYLSGRVVVAMPETWKGVKPTAALADQFIEFLQAQPNLSYYIVPSGNPKRPAEFQKQLRAHIQRLTQSGRLQLRMEGPYRRLFRVYPSSSTPPDS